MTRAPTGRPVIILRHPELSVRLAGALRDAGTTPFALPLTDTELPVDQASVVRGLEDLGRGRIDWLVLTSANAVRSLELIARGSGSPLGALILAGGARVAAVGASTARLLTDAGIAVDLVPARQSASGLLDVLTPDPGRGTVVLLPQADLAPDTLSVGLTASGWLVRRVVAYRTVPYPAAAASAVPMVPERGVQPPRLEPADVVALVTSGVRPAVVFMAPSAVRGFHDRVTGAHAVLPVAIGDTTAEALREAGHEPTVAADPSPEAIVRAVQVAFGRAARTGTPPRTPAAFHFPAPPSSSRIPAPPNGDQP